MSASPADALHAVRERTLRLVAHLSDAELERQVDPIMSPLVWDLAHIAAYEDLWLGHRFAGEPLLRPDLAARYDAFETPRAVRGDIELLDAAGARGYLAEVRERTLAALAARGPDPVLHELVLRHELQHTETMRQAMALGGLLPPGEGAPAPVDGRDGWATVPGGPFAMGADRDGFSYDNERPRHAVDVPAYAIARRPVTNGTWMRFVEGGGYVRREWWSDEGWAWKEQYDITHDPGVAAGRPDAPVCHVSWFEADAFARAHGARLPTEAEWEKAATWNQGTTREETTREGTLGDGTLGERTAREGTLGDGTLGEGTTRERTTREERTRGETLGEGPLLEGTGRVWEWTASPFGGYPGFVAHPYREYSEVFFGDGHRVLRGGSWATHPRVATPTFRNWDLPQRRQIFAGVRLAKDV